MVNLITMYCDLIVLKRGHFYLGERGHFNLGLTIFNFATDNEFVSSTLPPEIGTGESAPPETSEAAHPVVKKICWAETDWLLVESFDKTR